MKKENNAVLEFLHILPNVVKISPIYFIFFAFFSILHALLWFLVMKHNQNLYNTLTLFTEEKVAFSCVFNCLIIVSGVQILKHIANGIANYVPIVIKSKINQKLSFDLHEKIGKIDAIKFESTDFLEHIEKANRGRAEVAWNTITLFYITFFYIPYFGFVASYLFTLKPILIITILLVFLPILLSQFIRIKIFSKTEDVTAPLQRENAYYKRCIVEREFFKETRILGAAPFFISLFKKTLREINILQTAAERKSSLINICLQLFSLSGYLGILLLLFYLVISGGISIGAFAAVFQGISDVYKLMEEVMYSSVAGMVRDLGYIKNYTSFMKLDERKKVFYENADCGDIDVCNVNFKYPGSQEYVLNNINLHINKNEIVAIVGENGSGKTTLIRILTGVYSPDSGYICMNGSNSADCVLYSNYSAVFQNYQRYMMTLGENIRISDALSLATEETMGPICMTTGVIADNHIVYPNGLDTMLSREFGGVDVSGGQWQRIAIARGLYKKCSMIVLDEPTAAIDPIEERKIYNDFVELSRGKTAFIVTHRLGSVRNADRIVVLEKGKIVGNGSHEQLIISCSQYRNLFNMQKKWYT